MGSHTCNNLNTYMFKKLQKDKSLWYCIYCLQKELPYCSIDSDILNSFMHGNRIVSPNPKFISSVIRQSELITKHVKQNLYMYLNISSLSYQIEI